MRALHNFFVVLFVALSGVLVGCAEREDAAAGDRRTLVFVTDDIPAGLDYDGPSAASPQSQTGMVNLMEPLVGYARGGVNEDGVGVPDFSRFEGRLAESWTYDPRTLTWRFKLRKNVRSCAGNLLTAEDVVFTFARAKSVGGAAPIGWFLSSVASIDGFTTAVFEDEAARALGTEVRAIDEHTVEIRQSAPNALLLPVLTTFGMLIFDSKEVKAHATPDDPWARDYVNNVAAPGFGAYCLERWTKGADMTLRANPDYFAGPPAIERVVIKRVPQSSSRYIVLKMGEAHLTERLTPREFLKLREAENVRVVGVSGNESLFVHMNFKTPPFDDPRVRTAVAAALPYDEIVRNGYFGQAAPWLGVIPSSYPGFAPGVEARQDLERARLLLAAAGYPEGRGLEAYESALRLAYVSEKESTLGPIATSVQTALRRIGMPVTLDPIPATQFGDRQLVKKDLPFALNDQEKPVVVDAGYAIQLFFASAAAGGVNNMVNYESAEVDRMWSEARTAADPERRQALVAAIQRRLIADMVWAPVVEYRTQYAHAPNLEGLSWRPDNAVRFADLRFAP